MDASGTKTETVTLINTKLHMPRVTGDLISRPHLLERLNQGLDRKLTLISASAGYGKTTLVVDWLSHLQTAAASAVQIGNRKSEIVNRKVAWLSLDEDDGDLLVFLTYVVAAIRTIYPEACPQTQCLGQAPQVPPVDYIAGTFINEITDLPEVASTGPGFILVLDDFHTIHNDLINQLLTKLIKNLPAQIHLVICSRTDPHLPLAKLRVNSPCALVG